MIFVLSYFFLACALQNLLVGSFNHPSQQFARVCYEAGAHKTSQNTGYVRYGRIREKEGRWLLMFVHLEYR